MKQHNYQHDEILVIGGNPDSEIKAGIELGIKILLTDRKQASPMGEKIIYSFKEVLDLVEKGK